MKMKEELNALKAGAETLNKKLESLSENELNQVSGGNDASFEDPQIRVLPKADTGLVYNGSEQIPVSGSGVGSGGGGGGGAGGGSGAAMNK